MMRPVPAARQDSLAPPTAGRPIERTYPVDVGPIENDRPGRLIFSIRRPLTPLPNLGILTSFVLSSSLAASRSTQHLETETATFECVSFPLRASVRHLRLTCGFNRVRLRVKHVPLHLLHGHCCLLLGVPSVACERGAQITGSHDDLRCRSYCYSQRV